MPVQAQIERNNVRSPRKARGERTASSDARATAKIATSPGIAVQLEELIIGHLERWPARHRDLQECFGCVDRGVPHLDAVLAVPLRSALCSLNYPLTYSLWQRGLLPFALEASLSMMQFIALCLPAARGAQKESIDCLPAPQCVPASILIAEADLVHGPVCFEKLEIENNDVFRTGRKFGSLFDAFCERARRLAADARFAGVLESAENIEDYLRQIAACEIWTKVDRLDIIWRITRYDLLECDSVRSTL